jgi:putative membrane protein
MNNPSRDRYYRQLIFLISIAVFAVVVILSMLPKAETIPSWVKILPALNAVLNASTTLVLLTSLWFIKRKQVDIHKKLNLFACGLSTVFLLSYVLFHAFGVETRYPADAPMRSLYYFILVTHIILAAVVLPLVLFSLYRGLTNQVQAHRKIVKWSFPIWIYVTVTGVVVYLMISPYYKF